MKCSDLNSSRTHCLPNASSNCVLFISQLCIIICNKVNVHCHVDFQGRNIFIMYNVLQFLNSSFKISAIQE